MVVRLDGRVGVGVGVRWRKVRLTCVAAYEVARNVYYSGRAAWRYWVMHPHTLPAR